MMFPERLCRSAPQVILWRSFGDTPDGLFARPRCVGQFNWALGPYVLSNMCKSRFAPESDMEHVLIGCEFSSEAFRGPGAHPGVWVLRLGAPGVGDSRSHASVMRYYRLLKLGADVADRHSGATPISAREVLNTQSLVLFMDCRSDAERAVSVLPNAVPQSEVMEAARVRAGDQGWIGVSIGRLELWARAWPKLCASSPNLARQVAGLDRRWRRASPTSDHAPPIAGCEIVLPRPPHGWTTGVHCRGSTPSVITWASRRGTSQPVACCMALPLPRLW